MKISKRSVIVFSSVVVLGLSSLYLYKSFYDDEIEHSHEGEENYKNTNLNKIVVYPSETETFALVSDYGLIDSLARHSLKEKVKTIDDLAKYLNSFCKTDLEKSRAIYVWLTHNIRYDDEGFNNKSLKRDYSAKAVFNSKIAVCEGFSNLFLELGIKLNLQIQKISGYSKGYSYIKGMVFKESNHAWNIIKINNEWRVFDATWGEGYGETKNNKLVSIKRYNENWFNVNPYVAIYTHYPENPDVINCSPPITLKQYEVFPKINIEYFNFGFDPITTYTNVCNNLKLEFPNCYKTLRSIKVLKAPAYKNLQMNKNINLEIYAQNATGISIIDKNGNYIDLANSKNVFKINYIPNKLGDLGLAIKYDSSDTLYKYFMQYQVVTKLQ